MRRFETETEAEREKERQRLVEDWNSQMKGRKLGENAKEG